MSDVRNLAMAGFLVASASACSQRLSVDDPKPSPAATWPSTAAVSPTAPLARPPSSTSKRFAGSRALPVPVTVPQRTRGAMLATAAGGSAKDDMAMAVASDGSSNVIAGWLGGTGDIGCGEHTTANGATYVVKTTASGACSWAVYYEGSGFVSPAAVTIAPDGTIYVAGSFDGTATFDAPHTSAGGLDGFLVRLGPDGQLAWARTFGGEDDDYPYAVSATAVAVAVGGAFYGTITFGDAPWTSNGDADGFLAIYGAADGAVVASRAFGGPGWDAVNALTFDASGHAVAAGTHAGELDLGLGSVASAGGQDAFVAVYDDALHALAVRSFGGPADDAAHGVVIDASGRIVTAGYFMGSADVGAPSPLIGSGRHTALWAAYDQDLAFSTAATLESDGDVVAEALATSPSGDIIIGGYFTGTTTSGAASMTAGSQAGFAASFTSEGSLTWATAVRASGAVELVGLASGGSGVVAAGYCDGTIEGDTIVSAGGSDALVVTLGQ
jgi:hypothetical protein